MFARKFLSVKLYIQCIACLVTVADDLGSIKAVEK